MEIIQAGEIEIHSDVLEQIGLNPLPSYLKPESGSDRGENSFMKKYPLILSASSLPKLLPA